MQLKWRFMFNIGSTYNIWYNLESIIPIDSMYGIYAYIDPLNRPNVGIYGIHGASGIYLYMFTSMLPLRKRSIAPGSIRVSMAIRDAEESGAWCSEGLALVKGQGRKAPFSAKRSVVVLDGFCPFGHAFFELIFEALEH